MDKNLNQDSNHSTSQSGDKLPYVFVIALLTLVGLIGMPSFKSEQPTSLPNSQSELQRQIGYQILNNARSSIFISF